MSDTPSIYGSDPTGYADSISSDALGAPSPNAHSGNPIDQSARAKGNTGSEIADDKGEAKVLECGSGKAPKSKGN
jgi:hypothetical protein